MSLVVQSNSSGNALIANGTTSTSASSGSAVVLPFAQALVQTMGENTAQKPVTPILGNLASLLQGLLNAVQPTGKGSGDSVPKSTDVVAGLKEDIDKLDDSISADPALLAALQSWLLQVSALLSGSSTPPTTVTTTGAEAGSEVETEGGIEAAGSLSPLAQNPATIRFAIQDDLNSLVTLVQQAVVSGNTESAAKGINLLNNFTALLEQIPPTDNKNKAAASSVVVNSGVTLEQPAVTENKVSTTTTATNAVVNSGATFEQPTGAENKADSKDNIVKALPTWINRVEDILGPKKETSTTASSATVETDLEISNIPLLKVIVAAGDVKKTDVNKAELTEVKVVSEDHEVVTAGQLSMRDGITTPLKTEAAPVSVPVHRFAQEMSSFITGKLEIVQKGGIAEATISLFPENLGQVDVKITMQNGHLVAQFLTQNSSTKDMLDQQMNQLRTALQSQGLQVEKLEVTQNNTPLQSQFGQDGRQPGAGGQQSDSRSKKSREDSEDAILAAELNSEWKEWTANAVQSERNQGGTFSAKA